MGTMGVPHGLQLRGQYVVEDEELVEDEEPVAEVVTRIPQCGGPLFALFERAFAAYCHSLRCRQSPPGIVPAIAYSDFGLCEWLVAVFGSAVVG